MAARKWSSKPRAVRVREPSGAVREFPSVSAAGRALGMTRNNVHAYLAGRCGAAWKRLDVEYV